MLEPVLVTATVVIVTAQEVVFLLHGYIPLVPTDLWGRCGRCLKHLLVRVGREIHEPKGRALRTTWAPEGPGAAR